MADDFTAFSTQAQTAASHLCTSVMEELLWAISGVNHSDTFENLAIVLEHALSVASIEATRCQFCPKAHEIISITSRIRSIHQFKSVQVEFIKQLLDDCRTLKQLLQSIMNSDVHENRPSPSGAGFLHGSHDVRIDRATMTSVAGNSVVDASSNTLIIINQESSIGIRSVLVLLLLTFLFFHLLS